MSIPRQRRTSGGVSVVAGRTLQRLVAGLFGRPIFWAFFVGIAFCLPLVRVLKTQLPPNLPVLGTISEFELVDQSGRPYGTSELKGRVWLASAIETGSPTADKLAKALGKIQHRVVNLGPAFHLVTLGLDPDIDTQPALVEFIQHRRVSPRIWSFLSGDAEGIKRARQAAWPPHGWPCRQTRALPRREDRWPSFWSTVR